MDATTTTRRNSPDRQRQRLMLGIALSLLFHAVLLSLEFGLRGLGLPGLELPWSVRRATTPDLQVVLAPPPAPLPPLPPPPPLPAPAPAALPPLPPAPAAAAAAPATMFRLVPPRTAAPEVKRPPRKQAAVRPAVRPKPKAQKKLIAQDRTDTGFAVTPPDPDLPAEDGTAKADTAEHAAPVVDQPALEQPAPAPETVVDESAQLAQRAEEQKREEEIRRREAAEREETARREALARDEQRRAEERARAEALAAARRDEERRLEAERLQEQQKQLQRDQERLAEQRRQREQQAAAARQAELEQRRVEEARQQQAELETRRAEEEARQRLAELEQRRQAMEAERQRRETLQRQREAEELARRQAEETERRRLAEETERQRLAEEQARRLAEEQARKQAEESAARARAEEQSRQAEAARRQEMERERQAAEDAMAAAMAAAAARRQAGGGSGTEGRNTGAAPLPRNALGGVDLGSRAADLVRRPDFLREPPRGAGPERSARRSVFGNNDRDVGLSLYIRSWVQKIERNGNLNYSQTAKDRARADPIVTVAVRSDGTVEDVIINHTSGRADLDEAVRRIVRVNARYAAFPPELARRYDVIEIRRIWSFDDTLRLIEELR